MLDVNLWQRRGDEAEGDDFRSGSPLDVTREDAGTALCAWYAEELDALQPSERERAADEMVDAYMASLAMRKSRAHAAGRAWAEREAEAARDQGRGVAGPWRGTTGDALPLVDEGGGARELAELANAAAAACWAELCE